MRDPFHIVRVGFDYEGLDILWRGDISRHPLGHTSGHDKRNPAFRKSAAYSKYVREFFQHETGLDGLTATKDAPLFIYTRAFYQNGKHCDPENTHKLIKDAVFYEGGSDDKHTGGAYSPPLIDKENPRVEIVVWKLK